MLYQDLAWMAEARLEYGYCPVRYKCDNPPAVIGCIVLYICEDLPAVIGCIVLYKCDDPPAVIGCTVGAQRMRESVVLRRYSLGLLYSQYYSLTTTSTLLPTGT